MFTGIIEEIGKIRKIDSISGGIKFTITVTDDFMNDLKVNDSISINGICLTVVNLKNKNFIVEAVGETLKKTTIKELKINQYVNLEKAIKFSDRLGGHLVQGHVNGVGRITQLQKLGENYLLEVELSKNLLKYIINEGSIAIDGISLTIAKIFSNKISISIIPHTWKNTNLNTRKIGAKVNIETDLIAKYLENFIINFRDNKLEKLVIN